MPDGTVMTMNDVEVLQPWDFPIEVMPVGALAGFDPNYGDKQIIDTNEYQAIARRDTNLILGIHKMRYKPLEYSLIHDAIVAAIKAANISQDFIITVEVLEGGKKLRGKIKFPNVGFHIGDPAIGDYVEFKVEFLSSLDGTWAFIIQCEGERLWCLNGCTTPDPLAFTKYKHTRKIDVAAHAAKITTALEAFFNHQDTWNAWTKTPVSHEQAQTFFERTLAKAPSNLEELKTNNKQLEKLMGLWRENGDALGLNKWALFNACTYWQTHTEGEAAHNTRFRREGEMRKAMQSKHWEMIDVL